MINVLLWIAATVAMFHYGEGFLPVLGASVLGVVAAVVRTVWRTRRLDSLVTTYVSLYREAPPGFHIPNTTIGAVVGGATGHYGVSAAVGAGIDIARTLWNERKMAKDQKALHHKIMAVQASSPWRGWVLLVVWLVMSWMALGVMHIVSGG